MANRCGVAGRLGGRSGLRARGAVLIAALLALAVAAPDAMAWHGTLIVRKVNIGGPPADTFSFSLTKSPNAYLDVWNPAARTFELTGAPSAAGPFTEGATQTTFAGLWAGYEAGFNNWVTYKVTEAAQPGYTTTAGCSIEAGGLATTPAWTAVTTTTPGGDTSVATSVRFVPPSTAYTTTCTFTNVRKSDITLVKHFTGPSDPTDLATLGIDDQVKAGVGDGGSIGPVDVPGDSQHTISESGIDQSAYETTFDDCGLSGAGAPSGTGLTRTLTVPTGRHVVCNVTNRRLSGKLTLAKALRPAGAGEFNLMLDGANVTVAGSADDVTFGNGDQSDPLVVPTGNHVVAESVATAGQALTDYTTSLTCVNRAAQDASVPVEAGRVVAVHDGDDVLCTFSNVKLPGSGVEPVPPTSGSTSTGGGETTPVGSSRIVGPSGCVARAHATVGVRGHGIASVAFSIRGRRVRTVTRRDANGAFSLVVSTRTLPRGPTIVVARVTFRGGARPQTLQLQLSRCGARSVRPLFTG